MCVCVCVCVNFFRLRDNAGRMISQPCTTSQCGSLQIKPENYYSRLTDRGCESGAMYGGQINIPWKQIHLVDSDGHVKKLERLWNGSAPQKQMRATGELRSKKVCLAFTMLSKNSPWQRPRPSPSVWRNSKSFSLGDLSGQCKQCLPCLAGCQHVPLEQFWTEGSQSRCFGWEHTLQRAKP